MMSESIRIEELRKEIEKFCGNCDRPDKEELGKIILSSMTLGFNEGLKVSSADRPQGWIPCSERLPEDPNPSFPYASKTYQVTTASGEVVALKWHKTNLRGKTVMRWEWSGGFIYRGDALAWKPLSEPWKGADDDSDNI